MKPFVRDETLGLGDIATDRISGFTGTVIAVTEWLNGCRRITISPAELHEGKPVESHTFDAEQVEKIESGPGMPKTKTGGPAINPTQRRDPV